MSKLFAAGCSHTEGFEITVPNTLSPQDLELRWSKCLADLLNKQEVNTSRGGADLDMVTDFALEQLPTLTSQDICVILWPEPSRLVAYLPKYDSEFGFYVNKINNYGKDFTTITPNKRKIPGDVELFGDAYFELFNNNYNMEKRFYMNYLLVDNAYSNKGITVFHSRYSTGAYKQKDSYNFGYPQQHYKQNSNVISQTFVDYCLDKGYDPKLDGRDYHFTADAHRAWANYVYESIQCKC
jgi:hypothetical protein